MDKKHHFSEMVGLFGTLLILIAALAQWSLLLERTWAAIWAWYKFYGYGGGGHITVGKNTQILFYILSIILALVGLMLSHQSNNYIASRVRKKLIRLGSFALVLGTLFWTVILMSPFVMFR